MNTLGTYGDPSGVEIWKGDFDLNKKIEADYVIGHSAGANFALENRKRNKSGRIILVNPMFPQRNIFNWYFRLKKMHEEEGYNPRRERAKGFKNIFLGACNLINLLLRNPKKIFLEIPKEDVIVIRGKNDLYFCDNAAVDFVKNFDIKVIEVEGAGHNWCDKIQEEIDRLLEK